MSDIFRDSIFWVEVDRIKPNPFQPRREFDQAKLQELGESIRMYGLLQPLTVTRSETQHEDGSISVEYELIAGERRLRASKLMGIAQVPVIIRSGEETDQMKLELAIIENLQREDLNPIDRARAFQKLYKDFGFTHIQIGQKLGRSREFVSNTIRMLLLPEEILTHIAEGRIVEGHTRPLLTLNDRPEEQAVLVKEILLKKISVRDSEAIARRSTQERVALKNKINPEILSLERALTEKLGTRVTIETKEQGGRVVINFFSASDLQALLDSMQFEKEVGAIFNGTGPAVPPPTEEEKEVREEEMQLQGGVVVEEIAPLPEENSALSFVEEVKQEEVVPLAFEAYPVASEEPSLGIVPDTERPLPEEAQKTPILETPKREDDAVEELYSLKNFVV